MRKIVAINPRNQKTEIVVFEPADYLSTYLVNGANRPVMTNSLGKLDASLIDPQTATVVQLDRIAASHITAGDCVYAVDSKFVDVADSNLNAPHALVLGIAEQTVAAGATVTVIVMGIFTSSTFSIFSAGRPLYLDHSGGVTDEKPVSGYLVPIGKSLGNSQIFVQIGYPTLVGK